MTNLTSDNLERLAAQQVTIYDSLGKNLVVSEKLNAEIEEVAPHR